MSSPPVLSIALSSLPVAAYCTTFAALLRRGEGWRAAVIGSATLCGVYLALVTELLSWPHLITRPALAITWLLATLVSGYFYWRTPQQPAQSREPSPDHVALGTKSRIEWALLIGTGVLFLLVGLTAVIAAPNTWDAMSYHMSRIAQWMTNRDVANYPAFYSAQLFLSPWSEYAMLHLDLLYGGDRLVNLVEWASMVGTVIGASLIAKRLGAGTRGQIFAAVACATLPEGILEASGAMNTYVETFWIVAACYYALRLNERQSWATSLGLGATLGLAVFTKGTAYTFLPFLLIACWLMGPPIARRRMLARLPVVALVILILNGPLFLRNYQLSGSPLGFSTPLGNDPERQYANDHLSASIAIGNSIKNLALHTGTPVDSLNRLMAHGIDSLLRGMGIDPNARAATYRGGFHLNPMSSHESLAGDPLQVSLIILVALLLFSRRYGDRDSRLLMLGVIASFVLFCALVRWQAWNARYHLPLIAIGLAIAGAVLDRVRTSYMIEIAGLVLLVSATPFALSNSLRPLAPWKPNSILRRPRTDSYFQDLHQLLETPYTSVAAALKQGDCKNIGIDASLEDFDYPLFALLGAGHADREVRYTGVRNLTERYARPGAKSPCAVVCLRCANAPAKWGEYQKIGGRASIFDETVMFSSQGELNNDRRADLPHPLNAAAMLSQLDRSRDSLYAVGLGSVEARVVRASHDWPDKALDLTARLDGLYNEHFAAWRIRDSPDPPTRHGEVPDLAKVDPIQLLAATQVLEAWNHTIRSRIGELNDLVDQLYSSWEVELVARPLRQEANSARCPIDVRRVSAGKRLLNTSSTLQTVELTGCDCLRQTMAAGAILVRKPLGHYDREAVNATGCALVDTQPAPDNIVPLQRSASQVE
jgi:hypothetical protein